MRSQWTVLAIVALGVTLAAADEELYKGAKVKTLASAPKKDEVKKGVVLEAKKPQPQAQERQDTYGAPQTPVQDSYGSPQAAPVQDSYGAPQAAPVATAPVQGEVGTQGYYYYYYPVSNSLNPTQNYQSNKVSSSSSSGGGLLGGSNLGLLIFLGLGALVVLALVAATFTNNNNRRSFAEGLLDHVDTDELMFQVYNAIELYNRWSS